MNRMINGQATKTHTDIATILPQYIANISDKVATCSGCIIIIKTPRMRQKLASIYAQMFKFYRAAIEWYLTSKMGRAFRSLNENLKQIFDDAYKTIEDQIVELYRETALGSTAMVAVMSGQVSMLVEELQRQKQNYQVQDAAAGYRMRNMLNATWIDDNRHDSVIEFTSLTQQTIEPPPSPQLVSDTGLKRVDARNLVPDLESFINCEEGPAFFGTKSIWAVELTAQSKLRKWMNENTAS
jgi:hypothetical protein